MSEPGAHRRGAVRFGIRYGALRWLQVAVGVGPRWSGVEVDRRELRVRMGWAFSSVIPRSAVTGARRSADMWWGIGVHGWRHRWLVNGSVHGIVTIEIDPPTRARVIGVRVRLQTLHVSLDDPDGFLAALSAGR